MYQYYCLDCFGGHFLPPNTKAEICEGAQPPGAMSPAPAADAAPEPNTGLQSGTLPDGDAPEVPPRLPLLRPRPLLRVHAQRLGHAALGGETAAVDAPALGTGIPTQRDR